MNYICFISGNTFISVFLHRLPLPCRSFADHQMTNIGCLLGRFNFTSFNLLYNSVAIILNFCLCTIFMTTTTITTNCYWWCCLLSVPLPLPLHTTVGISFALLPSWLHYMPRTAPMAWPATLQCCTAVLVPCSASSSSGSQSIHISTALLNDASSYLRTRLTLAHATATATATAAATLTATDVDADDNFLQIKYIQRHTTTPPTTYTYARIHTHTHGALHFILQLRQQSNHLLRFGRISPRMRADWRTGETNWKFPFGDVCILYREDTWAIAYSFGIFTDWRFLQGAFKNVSITDKLLHDWLVSVNNYNNNKWSSDNMYKNLIVKLHHSIYQPYAFNIHTQAICALLAIRVVR